MTGARRPHSDGDSEISGAGGEAEAAGSSTPVSGETDSLADGVPADVEQGVGPTRKSAVASGGKGGSLSNKRNELKFYKHWGTDTSFLSISRAIKNKNVLRKKKAMFLIKN